LFVFSLADVVEWLDGNVKVDEARPSHSLELSRVQVVVRAILFVGSKSPSHLSTTLDRYSSLLQDLLCSRVLSSGEEGGVSIVMGLEEEMVTQASLVYASQPQRVLMVIDRLLGLGILKPLHVSSPLLAYPYAHH
jgi:hypothetical protein